MLKKINNKLSKNKKESKIFKKILNNKDIAKKIAYIATLNAQKAANGETPIAKAI